MQEIKLITLLKTLNKEEFRRLGKFLNSSFYNYSRPPVELYECLQKHYPTFDSAKLTKENIWRNIFPKEAFDLNKFWRLTSKLTRLTERFLAAVELENQPEKEQRLLIQSLAGRNKKLFRKKFEESENKLFEHKKDLTHFTQEQFLSQYNISNYNGLFNISEAIQQEENFLNRLELFYLTQKLKSAINLKSVERHRNLSYSFHFIEEIISLIENDTFKNHPQLKVLSNLFHLIEKGNPNLYPEVKKLFFNSIDSFNKTDKKFIFHQLLNFSIGQSSKGIREFRIEMFATYKKCLELNLLVEDGRITKDTFLNIVLCGADLKEFNWIKNFIQKYSINLDPEIKEDCIVLSKGYVFFLKEEYSETIDNLIHYHFRQTRDMLRAKGLLIRSYFELFLLDGTYFDLFISYANSYKKYLSRDKIESTKRIKLYSKFIKYLKKLVITINQNKFDTPYKNQFSNALSADEFNLKSWLIKRLDDI